MEQLPKYAAIAQLLRTQILAGDLEPGRQLPSQQEMAETYNVTLMTLRQALSQLESEGLVRAERGRGTFVSEKPVDLSAGNLSSFAQAMTGAGVAFATEVVDITVAAASTWPRAAAALKLTGDCCRLTRRRTVEGEPFSMQRSHFAADVGVVDGGSFQAESLYDAIESATGWRVAEATEVLRALVVSDEDAELLDVMSGVPALESIRTSVNQFGKPFLYDEALLVGDRYRIVADRSATSLRMKYDVGDHGADGSDGPVADGQGAGD